MLLMSERETPVKSASEDTTISGHEFQNKSTVKRTTMEKNTRPLRDYQFLCLLLSALLLFLIIIIDHNNNCAIH